MDVDGIIKKRTADNPHHPHNRPNSFYSPLASQENTNRGKNKYPRAHWHAYPGNAASPETTGENETHAETVRKPSTQTFPGIDNDTARDADCSGSSYESEIIRECLKGGTSVDRKLGQKDSLAWRVARTRPGNTARGWGGSGIREPLPLRIGAGGDDRREGDGHGEGRGPGPGLGGPG